MSIQFIYEDGNGTVVDEYSRPKTMYDIVDEGSILLNNVLIWSFNKANGFFILLFQ